MMNQYAKSQNGKVLGFFESEETPVEEDDWIPVLVAVPVSGWPTSTSPSLELHITAEGTLHWVETATLEELKVRKQAEITEAYLLANRTSFWFLGKEIQANEHSMNQIQITEAGIRRRGALRSDWQGGWKTLDNSVVLIPDIATWDQFMQAIEDTGAANFNKAQDLKTELTACTTSADVATIHW